MKDINKINANDMIQKNDRKGREKEGRHFYRTYTCSLKTIETVSYESDAV